MAIPAKRMPRAIISPDTGSPVPVFCVGGKALHPNRLEDVAVGLAVASGVGDGVGDGVGLTVSVGVAVATGTERFNWITPPISKMPVSVALFPPILKDTVLPP